MANTKTPIIKAIRNMMATDVPAIKTTVIANLSGQVN